MFSKSIRWRLQLWLGFLLICLLTGFGAVVYQLHRIQVFSQMDEELERRLGLLSTEFRMPPMRGPGMRPPFDRHPGGPGGPGDREEGGRPFQGPRSRPGGPPPDMPREMRPIRISEEVEALFGDGTTNAFYYAVWGRDGTPLRNSTNAPSGLSLPSRVEGTRTQLRMREEFREAYHYTELGDCVLVGRPIGADLRGLQRFALWLTLPGALVVAVGLGVGWWLTTRAIRPIEEISASASRISAGNLSERIRVEEPDNELGRLAAVLNSAFARLESAFAQQRQFTADASHELRTPLAVLISEAQTTLARPRSAEEYRETVAACLEISQELRKLTDSLLDLARSDAGEDLIVKEPVDLGACMRDAVGPLVTLAEAKGLTVEHEFQSVMISGDPTRLRQVLVNLVGNAIQYNREKGCIRIRVVSDSSHALLIVSDTGVGIDPHDIPHVFERFFRADKSRSRAAGHHGLGLAICQGIVAAHGGEIGVTSELGVGTTFTVRIPREASGSKEAPQEQH